MNEVISSVKVANISCPILNFPSRPKALLDRTVAEIYQVETKQLNQAFNRNRKRFPSDFYFQLTNREMEAVTKCDRFVKLKHSSALPKAYTLAGINMLANVLRSEIATRRSIQIVRAFTLMEMNKDSAIDDKWNIITAKIIAAVNNNVEKLKYDLLDLKSHFTNLEMRLLQLEKQNPVESNLKKLFEKLNTRLSTIETSHSKNPTLQNLSTNELTIIKHIKKHDCITNKVCRSLMGISERSVLRELNCLVRKGLIAKKGKGRGTCYILVDLGKNSNKE